MGPELERFYIALGEATELCFEDDLALDMLGVAEDAIGRTYLNTPRGVEMPNALGAEVRVNLKYVRAL